MHPSVAFRFHTQGYVKKERRLLSAAPFGRFTEALARRRPRIRGEIFLSFLVKLCFRKQEGDLFPAPQALDSGFRGLPGLDSGVLAPPGLQVSM